VFLNSSRRRTAPPSAITAILIDAAGREIHRRQCCHIRETCNTASVSSLLLALPVNIAVQPLTVPYRQSPKVKVTAVDQPMPSECIET